MASHDYAFLTRWRFEATAEEVYDVLRDVEALPRWWPAVYLEVKVIDRGAEDGIGRRVELFTKGWLPYTLRWTFVTKRIERPRGFSLEAEGDFVGRGEWTILPDGRFVDVTYDWRIRAEKPLLRRMSILLKPIFAANHEWAMARGRESLALELLRRRATTDAERARIPPPPPPTFRR